MCPAISLPTPVDNFFTAPRGCLDGKLAYATSMSSTVAKILVFSALLLGLLLIGVIESWKTPDLEESVRSALREVGNDRTYSMRVETLSTLDDRTLAIDGIYRIDAPRDAYASESTTTLTVIETGETHAFSLRNISLSDTVYVSVSSASPLLARTLPLTDGWQSFKSGDIPAALSGIATEGPILDNALIFADDGAHLQFIETTPEGAHLFTLRDPRARIGGVLQTLFERIGVSGHITVWLHDDTVSQFVFTGEDYVSTTTMLREPSPPIAPPL